MSNKTKWAVWVPKTGRYIASAGGAIQWTYDRRTAETWARGLSGEVIDAEVLRHKTFPSETSGPLSSEASNSRSGGEE